MFSPSRYVESGSLSVALFPEETAGGVAGSVTSTPEISHCDCAGVNCTQKKAWRPLDGDLESSDFMRSSGSLFGYVCAKNRTLT